MNSLKRPHPDEEFRRIKQHYPLLSSTGCTRAFCQSGRMVHTDEARVGYDADPEVVQQDAVDFLQQLRRDGIFKSDEAHAARKDEVMREITAAVAGEPKTYPGFWRHSYEELEHGIRLAWKHSRKCIMRSEYPSLKLKDLRHVTSSKEMGRTMLEAMHEAFNGGDIQPSVLVFPPKKPNSHGSMIWNSQLLSFAGYRQQDKTILGDPMNVALTDAIIALGWEPPAVRTKWDLLPLVTMMDGDEPYISPISPGLFPLVPIRHPRPEHALSFDKLGLRWVPAPALSQMGFDIGGVQYTATPFIGWFMDAEIGVRNLADSFRYDVLPSVVSALYLLPPGQELDEQPQGDKLRLLSQAQAELNYAVNWSFSQAGVHMSDSLTASAMYSNFDDDHLATHGFRLPADPYWIAPPEGSIVPIWHRGGAPNYQPKPMICKLQDNPIRVWRKLNGIDSPSAPAKGHPSGCPVMANGVVPNGTADTGPRKPAIRIFYCSAGTTAQRLAVKLEQKIGAVVSGAHEDFSVHSAAALNQFDHDAVGENDLVFAIISSHGYGDIPRNGQTWLTKATAAGQSKVSEASFCVFGNGSSSYADNFNGAGKKVQAALEKIGLVSRVPMFEADTRKEDPPWRQFNHWVAALTGQFGDPSIETEEVPNGIEQDQEAFELLLEQSSLAEVISVQAPTESGMKRVALDVGNLDYGHLSHIDVFVPPEQDEIDDLLWRMRLSGEEKLTYGNTSYTARQLLNLIDSKAPLKNLQWIKDLRIKLSEALSRKLTTGLMENTVNDLPVGWQAKARAKQSGFRHFFSSLPIQRARTFSAASSSLYWDTLGQGGVLELMVSTHERGLFTERFLSHAKRGDQFYVRVRRGPGEYLVQDDKPLVAFTTGSGIAPLRGLLQAKCARELSRQSEPNSVGKSLRKSPVSLFLGYKTRDENMIKDSIHEAQSLGLLDMVHMTPSNPRKERAQDKLFDKDVSRKIRSKIRDEGARVFVCATQASADDFARNLEAIIGVPSIRDTLGERWIEEVYVYQKG